MQQPKKQANPSSHDSFRNVNFNIKTHLLSLDGSSSNSNTKSELVNQHDNPHHSPFFNAYQGMSVSNVPLKINCFSNVSNQDSEFTYCRNEVDLESKDQATKDIHLYLDGLDLHMVNITDFIENKSLYRSPEVRFEMKKRFEGSQEGKTLSVGINKSPSILERRTQMMKFNVSTIS